jgi:hypothetical protein
MARKAKKSKAKTIAKRTMKKTKRATAKKAKAKKVPPKASASPLEDVPYLLGYVFYSWPSGH